MCLGPDPSFNPNLFSEDEDESAQVEGRGCAAESGHHQPPPAQLQPQQPQPPPIAPMTPRASRLGAAAAAGRPKQQPPPPPSVRPSHFLGEARAAEGYEDDYPYDYHQQPVLEHPVLNYCEAVRAAATPGCPAPGYHHRPAYASRCCDVPALQSPKNAVAPTQTLIATSSPNGTLVRSTLTLVSCATRFRRNNVTA